MGEFDRLIWFEGDGWKTEHFALTAGEVVAADPDPATVGLVADTGAAAYIADYTADPDPATVGLVADTGPASNAWTATPDPATVALAAATGEASWGWNATPDPATVEVRATTGDVVYIRPDAPTVELRVYDEDLVTPVATLDQPYAIKWVRERMASGAGEFTIPHDSPVVQASPAVVARERLVVCAAFGLDQFAWLIRRRNRARGDVWDPIKVTGVGAVETLRHALVYQRGGLDSLVSSDDRVFGWMTTDYDDSNWGPVDASMVDDPRRLSTPGWPDPDAVAFRTLFPGQRSLYRRRLRTVPGAAGPARMALVATVNTEAVVYLDGEQVLVKEAGERGVQHVDIDYREYDQQLAVEVVGEPPHGGRWGWTWMRLTESSDPDEGPTYGQALRRTYDPAEFPDADSPWLSYEGDLPYPGVTPGFILRRLFEEAQARGALVPLTIDFDDEVDSDGLPWPQEIEFACKVGDDTVLDVVERLRDEGVDGEVTPGLVFRAWGRRGRDRTGRVTFALDVAREADIETEDETFNVILARTQRGWIERPEPAPTTNRQEGFLSLGATPSRPGGAEVADDVLDEFQVEAANLQWAVHSTQQPPRPRVDYDLGDAVNAPRLDGITEAWREGPVEVDAIASQVDETGELDWIHEGRRA